MIAAGIGLARRLEAAEAANSAACARSGGGAVLEVGGGYAVFAGAGSPLTQAVGIGLSGPVPQQDVDRLETFFRARGADVNIEFCPLADPGLLDILCRRGYRVSEFNNALVRQLDAVPPSQPDARVRTAGPEDRESWSRTVAQGFVESEEVSAGELEVGQLIFGMPGVRCYFGIADTGERAAAGAMTENEGVAVLFADSTVPRFRRRGLHRALIAARLDAAAAAGCGLAMASTLPGSVSQANYERHGFQVAYTKVVLSG